MALIQKILGFVPTVRKPKSNVPKSSKIQDELLKPSTQQIYRGYYDIDIEMLRKYVSEKAQIFESFFVDGFGQRTLLECVPFASKFDLDRLTLPVPDDGFHAEALEYIALIDSIQRAGDSFCAVELGAGWAPWISLAGVLARKKNLSKIRLVGVEASPSRFELMRRQLAFNKLRPDSKDNDTLLDNIHCKLFEGAAGIELEWLYFPDVPVTDMGPATSIENCQVDYRGFQTKNIKVKAYTIREILVDVEKVDYLHIDIQGSEYEIIAANLALLTERVDGMMIATHSRVIEGKLIELLYDNGWYLHREKPCIVDWHSDAPTITGMTTLDGCQYWRRC